MLCLLLRRTSLAKSSDGGGERSEAKMLHTRFAKTVDGFAISEVTFIGKIQLIFDGMIKSTMESSDENVKGTARSITKSVTGDIRSGNNKVRPFLGCGYGCNVEELFYISCYSVTNVNVFIYTRGGESLQSVLQFVPTLQFLLMSLFYFFFFVVLLLYFVKFVYV